MNINFRGQTVLVTGATRGIGKQIADDMAKLGANLILTGCRRDLVDSLNRTSNKTGRGFKRYYAVDFTNPKSLETFIGELSSFKKIDVCINNAGINKIDFLDETEIEDWKSILSVNLEAPTLITRELSRVMKKKRYGRIVNIASIFGVISKEKRSFYSISKFGLRGLTVASAIELAPYNVLVNTVSPGFVLTDMTRRILSKKEMNKLSRQVPIGRFAMPLEISKVVMFLASKDNTYITGQNIIVDGGFVNV